MNKRTEAVNLNELLNELHAKKKWLDTVITALESALHSPDHRLIEGIVAAYSNGHGGRPRVDLRSRQQVRISRLASQVSGRVGRRNGAALEELPG